MSRSTPFTPQQSAILNSTVSVAVSAGAGCGKTFVLTQRFLSHLRLVSTRSDPLSTVVAITFTEKAAREMRHRVRLACEQELTHCDVELVDYWLNVLRSLDSARISTIHSFCSTLLRRFAVEASLDPAFGLLETSFGDAFTRNSVREGLAKLLEARDPDAMNFVVKYGIEGTYSKIRDLLYGVPLADIEQFDRHTPESLAQLWQTHFREHWIPRLVHEFWSSPAVQRAQELLQKHEPSNAVMVHRRRVLLDHFNGASCQDILTSLASIRDHAQVKGGGGKACWEDEEVYQHVMAAFKTVRDEVNRLQERLSAGDEAPVEAATLSLAALRIVRSVAEHHSRRKDDESRLDFDDLLCRTRNLLARNPNVRRRASAGVELLMVDEFQDTDPVQADLVRLLCGDALATGRLFLVGDSKQSIYRFRRADPRVFAALRNELPEAGRLPLTTNFRSQPAILKFVNFTFCDEIENYEPLEPASPIQHSPEPSVEFLFSRPDSDVNSEGAEGRRRQEAKWIANRISQLLSDETPRVIDSESKQLRRVQHGDIAILFRTLSNVHLYEQALIQADVPYYLAGGRAFFAQQEIHDVVHLCRWLDDPSDELSLVGVLRSPFFGLTDDTIFLLKPEKKSQILAGLQNPPSLPEVQAQQVRFAFDLLNELSSKKDRLPLASLLTLAIDRTGYDAALLCEHLGERKLANLTKLVGLARAFDSGGPYTLSDFANRLREAVTEQADEELAVTHPEVGNVVRLLTIHQSKGLEFPIVFVADMDWRRSGGDSGAYFHPQLGPLFSLPNDVEGDHHHLGQLIHRLDEAREDDAEQVRLLYVAVTRAKDHLILSAGLDSDGKPRSSWMKLLARKYDLLTGLPARDPYLGTATGRMTPAEAIPQVMAHVNCPGPLAQGNSSKRVRLPLKQFRQNVSESERVPLPPLLESIPASSSHRHELTVTEICEADHLLGGRTQPSAGDISNASSQRDLFGRARSALTLRNHAKLIGTLCHHALERLVVAGRYEIENDELVGLVEQSAHSLTGKIDTSLQQAVCRKLAAFMSSPLRRELQRAERIHTEVEFRLQWPAETGSAPLEILGAIDCFYKDGAGNWHLIDYKVVDDARVGDGALRQCYELQLAIYAIAFESFFGALPATLRIVRLGARTKLLPVSFEPEVLNHARRRIAAAIRELRGS